MDRVARLGMIVLMLAMTQSVASADDTEWCVYHTSRMSGEARKHSCIYRNSADCQKDADRTGGFCMAKTKAKSINNPTYTGPNKGFSGATGRKYCLSVNHPAKFVCTYSSEASCESDAKSWRKKGTAATCYPES